MTPQRPAVRPVVAVIGSLDPDRTYNPPLRSTEVAKVACREIGQELAHAGCDLLVFSSNPTYAEAHVAHGYALATSPEHPGTIIAHAPHHQDVTLDVPARPGLSVRTVRDTSGDWEVPYYRAILAAGGVILVGGGRSTRAAGVVALSQRIPVLPLACFGGGGHRVWVNLGKARNHASDADMELLGADWTDDSASQVVAALLRQAEEHHAEELRHQAAASRAQRSEKLGLTLAAGLLAGSVVAIPASGDPAPASATSIALLLAAPMGAAVAGAVIRNSFTSDPLWWRAGVRGFGAGLVSVLLYVASQALAVPDLFDLLDARRLLLFVVPLGFVAGFTFDLVFERLRHGIPPDSSVVPGQSGP